MKTAGGTLLPLLTRPTNIPMIHKRTVTTQITITTLHAKLLSSILKDSAACTHGNHVTKNFQNNHVTCTQLHAVHTLYLHASILGDHKIKGVIVMCMYIEYYSGISTEYFWIISYYYAHVTNAVGL